MSVVSDAEALSRRALLGKRADPWAARGRRDPTSFGCLDNLAQTPNAQSTVRD
jgi:hypothetical protein